MAGGKFKVRAGNKNTKWQEFDYVVCALPPVMLKGIFPEAWDALPESIKNIVYKKTLVAYFGLPRKEKWTSGFCTYFPSRFPFKRLTRLTYFTTEIAPP